MRYRGWRLSVFAAAASLPVYWLYLAGSAALGPDPGKALTDNLGHGALVLLLVTLAMTPLQQLSRWGGWIAIRRQLGLWSFTYASLHLAGYCFFILGLDVAAIPAELRERPYMAMGALGYLGLLALAATSTTWSIRRLGRGWKRLHRLVYPILVVVLLHMLWVVRADLREWGLYAAIGALLLAGRMPWLSHRLIRFGHARSERSKKSGISG